MSPSKHAREAARLRAERQAAKREAARKKQRNMRIAIVATVVLVAGIAALVGVTAGGSKSHNTDTLSQPTAAAGQCAYPASRPSPKDVGKPSTTPAGKKVTATVKTNDGDITFTMDGTKAPCTVNAFTFLASKGYFNNTKCHRLTTTGIYVLQCGSPDGSGSGGPGFSFADENLTGLGTAAGAQAVYPAGTVAMANSGANTNGSQFFLVYKDSPLAASYTPFGTLSTEGLNTVDKIAKGGSTPQGDGKPNTTVEFTSFTVS